MNSLARFNPARRLVGRLFLWFWVTFIFTAVVTFYAVSFFNEHAEVRAPDARELEALNRAVAAINRVIQEDGAKPARRILEEADRISRHRLIAVGIDDGAMVQGGGPPVRRSEEDDLTRLAKQASPLSLVRGNFETIGPARVAINGKDFAIYVSLMNGPPDSQQPLMYFLSIALVITIALSYLFARSLVRPITILQETSRELAGGNWKARVKEADGRRDELGSLSRDFNAMASQLEQMWLGQQRLLADISHELRSPLARLQMAVGLAHQQNVDPAALARIEREAERMDSMIGQLLTLTRAESGKPEISPVMISVLFDRTFADARFEASNRNIRFEVAALPQQTVNVNSMLLCSAVENVVRNAIRYAESSVSVTVSVKESQWFVVVKDDGPGLSEEECSSVFAPFYRASLARDRESGGVGLGLAIAKAAVEMHHGDIKATRNASGGLAVTISLPLDGRDTWSGQSPQNTH